MFDEMIASLDRLIDRHFAAQRTLVVERESAKHWTASVGDDVLYRSPDGRATLRFAKTFAHKTAGVTVTVVDCDELDEIMDVTEIYAASTGDHSMRVTSLRVVEA